MKTMGIFLIVLILVMSGCTNSDDTNESVPVNETKKYERTNLNLDGKIVDIKFDRDDYIAGEKVTAELSIANIGTEIIENETVEIKAKVTKLDDYLANMFLRTMSEKKKTRSFTINFSRDIEPEKVEKLSAIFRTQKEMEGRNLAGTYEVTIDLFINGQWADSRVLPINLKKGTPRVFTPTPTPIPTSTPIPTIMATQTYTPTPTPTPVPVVVATPTGANIPLRIMTNRFTLPEIQIDAGDEITWSNYDDQLYTLVEMNDKMENISIRQEGRESYTFYKTGEYTFGLYYRYMRTEPDTQKIIVTVNTSK